MPSANRLPGRVIVAASVALTVLAACDDDSRGDSEGFCQAVADNLDALRAIPTTGDEVEALIERWREVGESAPLAVEPDWDAYTATIETAWTGADEEEILANTFASERSATNIATWLRDNCAIEWGPMTTIVPSTTTTVSGTVAPSGT
jgi:hypothetical protein